MCTTSAWWPDNAAASRQTSGHHCQQLTFSAWLGRLTSILEGALAANIFDWGARDTVALYKDGTILEIYRHAPVCSSHSACANAYVPAELVRLASSHSTGQLKAVKLALEVVYSSAPR